MGVEENKAVAVQFIRALNEHDLERWDRLVAPTVVRHCDATPMVTVQDLDDLKAMVRRDAQTFPDQQVDVHFMFGDEKYLAAYLTFSGTQTGPMGPFPATGKRAAGHFIGPFRFDAGKIAEMWVEWDNVGLLMQLGHLQPPGG